MSKHTATINREPSDKVLAEMSKAIDECLARGATANSVLRAAYRAVVNYGGGNAK